MSNRRHVRFPTASGLSLSLALGSFAAVGGGACQSDEDVFEPGDGTVPVSSARPGGEALLFCDGHQGMATDPNVHRTLIRLLRDQR